MISPRRLLAAIDRRVRRAFRTVERSYSWLDWRWSRLRTTVESRPESQRLHIAIVSHHPSLARESKLGHAIRAEGHRVSLIMLGPLAQSTDVFHNTYEARNEWHALQILDQLQADVVHVIAPSIGHVGMLRVLRQTRARTVFDAYDCTEGMIKPEYLRNPERCYAIERACFSTADHICARSLEPLYLRREFGYQMAGVTYFPEYCWQLPRQRPQRTISDEEELHIVYAGGVVPENRMDPSIWSYAQYIEIGRILAEQLIHLHIYPAPKPRLDRAFDDYYSLYLEESQRNRFFHFYRPLPFQELTQRLPEYDAGLHILGRNIIELGRNTEAKLRYSTTNKIFDYLEAGLPIVIHPGFHQHGLTRHYGEAVRVTDLTMVRSQLVAQLKNRPRPPIPAVVIDGQAHRLIAMYRLIMNGERR